MTNPAPTKLMLAGLGAAFLTGVLAARARDKAALPGDAPLTPDADSIPGAVKVGATAATVAGYPIAYVPLAFYIARQLERRGEPAAQTVPASAVAAWAAFHILKSLVPRQRPSSSQGESNDDRSFPSGHATAAAAVALSATYLWLRHDDARRKLILSAAIGAPTLIGASRVLLGKHWPSDIVGGLAAGAAVAAGVVTNG